MCGIALVVSGVQIDSTTLHDRKEDIPTGSHCKEAETSCTLDNLTEALHRRGPDNVGCKIVHLEIPGQCNPLLNPRSTHIPTRDTARNEDATSSSNLANQLDSKSGEWSSLTSPLFDMTNADIRNEDKTYHNLTTLFSKISAESCYGHDEGLSLRGPSIRMHFIGATLQLRGVNPVGQPLEDNLGNILLFNGEIFGGLYVGNKDNDSEVLMNALQRCCSCSCHVSRRSCFCSDNEEHTSVPEKLSAIKGPWALVYWQVKSRTMWFGRDAFGRRSLLIHWPTLEDKRLLLSSVAPLLPNFNDRKGHQCKFKACDIPCCDFNFHSTTKIDGPFDASKYWEELPCGIHSIHFDDCKPNGQQDKKSLVGTVGKHEWVNSLIKNLIAWNRTFVDPNAGNFVQQYSSLQKDPVISQSLMSDNTSSNVGCFEKPLVQQMSCHIDISFNNELIVKENTTDGIFQKINNPFRPTLSHNVSVPANHLLVALRESVSRRTVQSYNFEGLFPSTKPPTMALLFSGGLDSMILAALMDQCLEPHYEIDLLNVSFDGHFAPDRISAKEGIGELQRIAPSRRWRLVEIDADFSKLESESKHVMSLINPANTYMVSNSEGFVLPCDLLEGISSLLLRYIWDLNIGMALWLAAGGDGWINEGTCDQTIERRKYKSEARILLVGSGADEQCAGYGRHRTKYRLGGWVALQEELQLDMQRIWKRNLGRDDRCISDRGKEARFPFLDEDVIRYLLAVPLWQIADLDKPIGIGDKKILREVALLLGLEKAATLPKRAIQFGSRVARESNRKNFGSNRAANQASAGGVVLHSLRH